MVFPGERRGEITVSLGGDLAAFLHAAGAPESGKGTAGDPGCWTLKGPFL